jgi:hypothetical protein
VKSAGNGSDELQVLAGEAALSSGAHHLDDRGYVAATMAQGDRAAKEA